MMVVGYDGYAEMIKRGNGIAANWNEWYNKIVKMIEHKGKTKQAATDILRKKEAIEYAKNGR